MTTVPEEAVNSAEIIQVITDLRLAILQDDDEGLAEHAEPMIKAKALISKLSGPPHLPGVGVKADTLKLIERMAYGYEVMFEKLCHISGTSGADQSWYRAKAREATERLSPMHSITTESNKSVPGDCKRQYQDFMSRILSTLEPSAAACPCTLIQQDETCPVGYPSLLCEICDGKGVLQPSAARDLALEEDFATIRAMIYCYEGDSAQAFEAQKALANIENAIRALGTSREQLNKAVSNVPDQQENEPGAQGERERVLEEGDLDDLRSLINYAKKIGHKSFQSMSIFDDFVLSVEGAEKVLSALSSPDHADAGKVEGDGWLPSEYEVYSGDEWQAASTDLDGALDYAVMYAADGFKNITVQEVRRRTLPSAPSKEMAGS
nr:hypothetical protein [Brucella intermedia]